MDNNPNKRPKYSHNLFGATQINNNTNTNNQAPQQNPMAPFPSHTFNFLPTFSFLNSTQSNPQTQSNNSNQSDTPMTPSLSVDTNKDCHCAAPSITRRIPQKPQEEEKERANGKPARHHCYYTFGR